MRLYSPEWAAAFNESVAGLAPEPGVCFRMHQVVLGGPDGTLHVTLDVGIPGGDARTDTPNGIVLRVERGDGARTAALPAPPGREPHVTVVVAYDDAAALARGDVDPAELLRAGRVKVRGDLSALVAGQKVLAQAASRLESLSERTTF